MGDTCILQVEDDGNDVFLLQKVFKQAGIADGLRVATDGQMAMDYLSGAGPFADRQKYPIPVLVLLDLKMPKIDGLEVLKWIRRQPHLKKLVVVLFSSSSMPEDVERAYELGVNSYIRKPTDFQKNLELAQLIKGWWLGFNQFAPIDEAHPPKVLP
jgi:CheY-like chemotaxis protein